MVNVGLQKLNQTYEVLQRSGPWFESFGGEGMGGEIFNLKCLVQFLEGEGRGGGQILLHFQNYPYISLKSQYYPCNNICYH